MTGKHPTNATLKASYCRCAMLYYFASQWHPHWHTLFQPASAQQNALSPPTSLLLSLSRSLPLASSLNQPYWIINSFNPSCHSHHAHCNSAQLHRSFSHKKRIDLFFFLSSTLKIPCVRTFPRWTPYNSSLLNKDVDKVELVVSCELGGREYLFVLVKATYWQKPLNCACIQTSSLNRRMLCRVSVRDCCSWDLLRYVGCVVS